MALRVRLVSGDVQASLLRPHQVLVAAADAARLSAPLRSAWRLRADSQTECCRLEIVRDGRDRLDGGLAAGVAQVHPWAIDALGLRDGDSAVLQQESADGQGQAIRKVVLAVVSRSPLRTTTSSSSFQAARSSESIEGSAAAAASQLPESVRSGLVDLAAAVARQLRAMYGLVKGRILPRDLVPIQLMGETFVFRVVDVEYADNPPEEQVSLAIEVLGVASSSSLDLLTEELSALRLSEREEDEALTQRLWELGYTGYTPFVQEAMFCILLNTRTSVAVDAMVDTTQTIQALASRGIILYGVQGVGKSHALRVIDSELSRRGVVTWRVDAMSLLMEYDQSKSSSAYEFLLSQFQQFFPSFGRHSITCTLAGVLLIDDLHILFQSTSGAGGDDGGDDGQGGLLLVPLGSALLRFLDSMIDQNASHTRRVCIVGTASTTGASGNDDDSVPSVAKRSGRFDKLLEIIVPTEAMRRDILVRHLSNLPIDLSSHADINSGARLLATRLADLTGGYVAEDLVRICRSAYIRSQTATTPTSITWDQLILAQRQIKPSQLQQLNVASPSADSITSSSGPFAGYEALQKQLCDFIDWKFHPSEAMKHLGVANASGLLIHGPSGCGKSLLVKALAARARVNFVSVKSSELLSKYFGDSERAVRQLFARARAASPCLLFFDEFDSIAHKRSFGGDSGGGDGSGVYARILSTFLNEMDGVGASKNRGADILVVAATNRVEALDAALIRPGRIDKTVELGFPGAEDIQAIFQHYTRKMPLSADVDLAQLAGRDTESRRFTGADIAAICKEAAFRSLREDMEATSVRLSHFVAAWDQRMVL